MAIDTPFVRAYVNDMVLTMKKINPDWDEDDIRDVVNKEVEKKLQVIEVTMDNNTTRDRMDTTLNSVFDYAIERKPIIAGNGTFYKHQSQQINPNGKMLTNLKADRSRYKKLMFEEEDPRAARMFDLRQRNKKIDMNSYYGGSGMPQSPMYSQWSGPATTLSAQSVISTTEQMFESFIADNYQFINITELCHWINDVLTEDDTEEESFIVQHSLEEVRDRLSIKILEPTDEDEEIITSILLNMNQAQLDILYYKNNLIAFIKDHEYIQDIFTDILNSVENLEYKDGDKSWNKKVNKEFFMDPNDPPQSIIDKLDILREFVMKYVYANYLAFDRIYRLRNMNRACVVIIDTDSNILSFDTIMEYLLDNIVKDRTFGRDKTNNVFILVNTITYLTTEAVKRVLYKYATYSNIDEDYKSFISMKNEFFFSRLIVGLAKKRYISKIVLQEGHLLNPASTDIKGFDFKKSTCSDYTESVFVDIIDRNLINNTELNIVGMMRDLKKFRDDIESTIRSGDTSMLQNISVKDPAGYDDPSRQMNLRAVFTWNFIYPDDPIEFPAKCTLLKLTTFTEDDILPLGTTNPDIYEIIMDKIFNDDTGIFVVKRKKTNKKTGEVEYNIDSKGMQGIAIPFNRKIPEWVFPYVDWSTTINNIIAPFNAVKSIFGVREIDEGKNYKSVNRTTSGFSNIIKF